MAQTLVNTRLRAAGTSVRAGPRAYWNPYLTGMLLGLVLLATYLVTGRGLGATGAFGAVAAWLAGLFSPEHAATNLVHAKYWNDGAPLESWTLFLLVGAFVGALVSGIAGRRIAFKVERGPRVTDGQRLALAFVGGFVAAYGAKIAKGCTSGQALTGGLDPQRRQPRVHAGRVRVGVRARVPREEGVAVMFPLSSFHEFSTAANLALAVVLGFGFGFCLERAGFGSARKLTAVFYLYDMAVVKVMFTAIVTAMTGIFVLSAAGVLDVGRAVPRADQPRGAGDRRARVRRRLHRRRILPGNDHRRDGDRPQGRLRVRARHARRACSRTPSSRPASMRGSRTRRRAR